ncbi:flagellar protein [Roseibium sp.]|uniref:flagellar protein n=1 Tax=Roseibium sp. TaxID=1936156 RepID=UPI003A97681C
MAIDTISTSRHYMTRQITSLSKSLNEKTSQLASGKEGTTYGAVGNSRLLDLELTQKVKRIEAYEETIVQANLHIKTMNLTLDRLENIRIDGKASMDLNDFELQNDGQTRTQATAELLLYEAASLLNTEVAGYYLYGGGVASEDPVSPIDAILDGAGGLDGLRMVMDEFGQANLGANNNGRLDVSALATNYAAAVPTDSTFSITEDGAHDFGFDLASATSNLSNVTLTGPAGTGTDPDSLSVEFTGQPTLGETISIDFTLPPDHTESITLEFTAASSDTEEGAFAIGADLEETAGNLRTAINEALEREAATTLKAASDKWAADSFFDTFGGADPVRVDGPPFDTATATMSGAGTTVEWYIGENDATTNARTDKTAVIDDNLNVNYGVRANEEGLTDLIKALSVFIAADFSGGGETDELYYGALTATTRGILAPTTSDESGIVDIATDISIAYRAVDATSDRHMVQKSSFTSTIEEIEGVDNELLAAEILQLKTNIEASYRASSIVYQLSLTDYI